MRDQPAGRGLGIVRPDDNQLFGKPHLAPVSRRNFGKPQPCERGDGQRRMKTGSAAARMARIS